LLVDTNLKLSEGIRMRPRATMGRIFKYPELLFVALVVLAPLAMAFLWRSSTASFFLRLALGLVAGLAVWLLIIFLIVRPRYRNY